MDALLIYILIETICLYIVVNTQRRVPTPPPPPRRHTLATIVDFMAKLIQACVFLVYVLILKYYCLI